MYIFIYSNHNINLRSSIANRIFLTMLLIATIVCAYRIIYMFFFFIWIIRNTGATVRMRGASFMLIVSLCPSRWTTRWCDRYRWKKCARGKRSSLLLDSRFAKKEKKNKKIKIRNTYRLGYSSKILAKHLEDKEWTFWIGSEGTKLYFRSTSTISVHARRLRYYLSDVGAAGIRFHLFSSFFFFL